MQQPAFGSKHGSNVVEFRFSPQHWELVRGNDSIAGSFFSTGDLVRGNNPVARVEESLVKGNRDHDSNSVRTSSDKQNLHEHLERKAESAVRGENAAQERLSEAEADIDGEQKGSELALCHTHQELESQRLQQHQVNQWADQALREKINLCGELDMRNRLFNESRTRSCQEIEELRRICCEETDRARRARIDELSRHQERDLSTASQLLTQIQDLQNKVNSLSDARELHDPEMARSSGASHVPSQKLTMSSPGGVPRCDSGLPLDTRNFMGTSVNDHLLKKDDPPQSSRRQRILASSSQELRPDIAGTTRRQESEMKREPLNTSIPLPHFQRGGGMWNHPGGTYSYNDMVE